MSHMRITRRFLHLCLLGALVLLSACQAVQPQASSGADAATGGSEAALPDLGAIQIGYIPVIAATSFFVAIENDYFAEQGLQVEPQRLRSSEDVVPLLATGKLDVAVLATTPAFFNAIQQNLRIQVVASADSVIEPKNQPQLVVSKALFDAGTVTKVADLKGLKVAINVKAGFFDYLLAKALAQGGLTIDDVEVVILPLNEMQAALSNGAIDAAMSNILLAQQMIDAGVVTNLLARNEIVESTQGLMLAFGPRLLQPENREIAVRVLMAHIKAARQLEGDNWLTDEYASIINKYTEMKPESIRALPVPIYDRQRRVNEESLLDQQAYAISRGYVEYQEPLTIAQIVDSSFLEEALTRMGK